MTTLMSRKRMIALKNLYTVTVLAIALLMGGTARAQWEITWDNFSQPIGGSWTRLPDGDVITYSVEEWVTDPAVVEFRLIVDPHITWWKEIDFGVYDRWKVWSQDRKSWCNWPYASTANCNTNSEWADVIASPDATVIFSKAKEWGVHRQMYVLRNLGVRLKGGDRVTFHWHADSW